MRIQALHVGAIAIAGGVLVALLRFVFIERWLFVDGRRIEYVKLDPVPSALESAAEGAFAAATIWVVIELALWLYRRFQ